MDDREKWRERVRDIRASGTTWWWWLCTEQINSRSIRKQSFLLNKTLICTGHLQWMIRPNLVLLVVGDKSSWPFQCTLLLVEAVATGGRVSQRTAKQTRGFPHQQERSWYFQSKWLLLNVKEFLFFFFSVDKSCLLGKHSSGFLSEVSSNY